MTEPEQLEQTARALVAPAKGILAADESHRTMEKRFKAVGVESTEETRRAYREMLFTTAGLGDFISGVILFDETLRQKAANGTLHGDGVGDETSGLFLACSSLASPRLARPSRRAFKASAKACRAPCFRMENIRFFTTPGWGLHVAHQ
jgi:hypothetical protein